MVYSADALMAALLSESPDCYPRLLLRIKQGQETECFKFGDAAAGLNRY